MIEPTVPVFIGDFHDDVGKPLVHDPFCDVRDSSSDGVLVFENLILTLVEAAEDDDRAVLITPFDHSSDAMKVCLAQRSIRVERRIYCTLLAGHSTLEID